MNTFNVYTLERIYIFMIVSHSVLKTSVALRLSKACFLSLYKILLFSSTFLVRFASSILWVLTLSWMECFSSFPFLFIARIVRKRV